MDELDYGDEGQAIVDVQLVLDAHITHEQLSVCCSDWQLDLSMQDPRRDDLANYLALEV